jgi:membrane protein DedA with SNARE-associated domain
MSRTLTTLLFHKPLPLSGEVLLWLAGALAALGIGYSNPGVFVQAVMLLGGLLLLAIWYRYARLAIWTSALNNRSFFLKLIAVTGSVLLASVFAMATE